MSLKIARLVHIILPVNAISWISNGSGRKRETKKKHLCIASWNVPLADPELQFRGVAYGERQPITGVWGRSPRGSRGRAPGQRGPESILALGRPTDTANLHPWPVAVFSV